MVMPFIIFMLGFFTLCAGAAWMGTKIRLGRNTAGPLIIILIGMSIMCYGFFMGNNLNQPISNLGVGSLSLDPVRGRAVRHGCIEIFPWYYLFRPPNLAASKRG